ncbi:hypothetical protein P3T37_000455 [Kitasatospora sp. MAA4]|uniref:hypothetical protein n=1 Tax=Kitasatospora sp. MAA4 TaxID=3035093 RepID=UPI002473342D|nr:hypothetical protein [Kitasatospora sp. MAA4]MDH6131088.1 hypothetical protein [Kitasatospora sp. MAA4]
MYLTKTTVDTGGVGAAPHSAEQLHRQLLRSTAGTDSLQHARIVVHEDCVVFCLYVQARDLLEAARVAEQLCCRTMASACRGWAVRSTEVGP